MRRFFRACALLLCAASATAPPALAAAGAPTGADRWVRVDIDLRQGEPAETRLEVRTRLAGPGRVQLLRLRGNVEGSRAYRDALIALLSDSGLPVREDAVLRDLVAMPDLEIGRDGTATLRARFRNAPFAEIPAASELRVTRGEIPAGTRMTIAVSAPDGGRILAATPLPAVQAARDAAVWEYAATGSPQRRPAISVRFSPRLWHESSGRIALRPLSAFAHWSLAFLCVLLARLALSPALRRLALVGAALCAGCAIGFAGPWRTGWIVVGSADDLLRTGASVLPAAVPLVAFVWSAPGSGVRSGAAAALATAGAFGCFALGRTDTIAAWVAGTGGIALTAVLVLCCLRACGRWAAGVAPELARPVARVTGERRLLGFAVAAAGLITLQLTLSAWRTRQQGPFADDFAEGRFWPDSVEHIPQNLLGVANLMLSPAKLMVLAGLMLLVWREASGRDGLAIADARSRRAIVLLFALVVVGTGGELDGYQVPVPFLIALVLLRPAAQALARSRRAGLAADAGVQSQRRRLLGRAARTSALQRRHTDLYDRYAAGDVPPPEYHRQRADIHKESADHALLRGPDGSETRLRSTDLPALGLGLGTEARPSARLRALWPWGLAIVLVPIAYAAYWRFAEGAEAAFSSGNRLGGAFFVLSLVQVVMRWGIIVALFLLLFPLLPGRTPALKGFLFAMAYAIPSAAGALILSESGVAPQGWILTGAILALVLISIGVLSDYRTVVAANMHPRQLLDLYRVTSVRAGFAYAAPVVVLVATVVQQLLAGEGGDAVRELVEATPSLVEPEGR